MPSTLTNDVSPLALDGWQEETAPLHEAVAAEEEAVVPSPPAPAAPPSPVPLYATLTPAARVLVTLTVMAATLMEFLDTSIVNVALPDMMGNLGATLDQIGWVSTGYIITNVVVLPLTGWLSDYFGRKRYLTGSVLLFTAASLGCGLSHSLGELVFWRVIQGAGGAAFLATAQATLMEVFPPEKRASAQATFALGVVVAPTLGPTLGGCITDNYSWPWIFFINVPVGIIAAILSLLFLPDSAAAGQRRRADFLGIGLLAVGLGCLQTILERGERDDWFDAPYIVVLTVLSVLSTLAFLAWALHPANPRPAVNLRVLANRNLAAGTVYAFGFGLVYYGIVFVVPEFLQNVQAHTAQAAGLILLPGGLAAGATLPLVSRFAGRMDTRLMIGAGMAILVVSMALFTGCLTLGTPDEAYLLPLILRGVGVALQLVPLSLVALGTLPPQQVADGAGIYNLFRQLGGSFGIALLTTLLERRERLHYSRLADRLATSDPDALARLSRLQDAALRHGASPDQAHGIAMRLMTHAATVQADVLAYKDVFTAIGWLCAAAMLLLLFFERPQRRAAPADAH